MLAIKPASTLMVWKAASTLMVEKATVKEERYEFDYVKERDAEGAAGAFQV